jgi:hypothetical protein
MFRLLHCAMQRGGAIAAVFISAEQSAAFVGGFQA